MQAAEMIVDFHTANGVGGSDSVLPRHSKQIGSIKPRILEDTPDAYTVGYRCMEEGWGFSWPPYAKKPVWVKPDGTLISFTVDCYVPYVMEDGDDGHVESVIDHTVPLCPTPDVKRMDDALKCLAVSVQSAVSVLDDSKRGALLYPAPLTFENLSCLDNYPALISDSESEGYHADDDETSSLQSADYDNVVYHELCGPCTVPAAMSPREWWG